MHIIDLNGVKTKHPRDDVILKLGSTLSAEILNCL